MKTAPSSERKPSSPPTKARSNSNYKLEMFDDNYDDFDDDYLPQRKAPARKSPVRDDGPDESSPKSFGRGSDSAKPGVSGDVDNKDLVGPMRKVLATVPPLTTRSF